MKYNLRHIIASLLALLGTGLIIAGFLVPPMGTIDGSVLQGAGEIIVMQAIFAAWDGIGARFQHGKTSVTLNGRKTTKTSKKKTEAAAS